MTTYTSLLNQGRALAYQVQSSLAAFDTLFTNGNIPLTQRAVAIFNEIRNTSRLAISAQSIYDQLCATTARVEQLTNASQAAIGELQATQASTQMLAVIAQQQNGMHELQANTARLQTLVYMQQVVEEEAAQKAARTGSKAGRRRSALSKGLSCPREECMEMLPLPQVTFGFWEELPEIPAVYFSLANNGEVLYIGSTINLYLRWSRRPQHHKFAELQRERCVVLAWQEMPVIQLLIAESVMVDSFRRD